MKYKEELRKLPLSFNRYNNGAKSSIKKRTEVIISAVQNSARVERPDIENPLLRAKSKLENIESDAALNTFLHTGHLYGNRPFSSESPASHLSQFTRLPGTSGKLPCPAVNPALMNHAFGKSVEGPYLLLPGLLGRTIITNR